MDLWRCVFHWTVTIYIIVLSVLFVCISHAGCSIRPQSDPLSVMQTALSLDCKLLHNTCYKIFDHLNETFELKYNLCNIEDRKYDPN